MSEIIATSFPFQRKITVEPRSTIVIKTIFLNPLSTLRISCVVEEGKIVGAAGGAKKFLGAITGKQEKKGGISDIGVRVFTPHDGLYSPDGWSEGWKITGTRSIDIPVGNLPGQWHIVFDNEESKATQKNIDINLEELSWKESSPIEFSVEVPSKDLYSQFFPVIAGDTIQVAIGVKSSDIDFYVVGESNVIGNTINLNSYYIGHRNISSIEEELSCQETEKIAIVLDNRGSKFKSKIVNVRVSAKLASSPPEKIVSQPPISEPVATSQKEMIRETTTVKEVYLVLCPSCNHRNDVSSRFCGKCGASI